MENNKKVKANGLQIAAQVFMIIGCIFSAIWTIFVFLICNALGRTPNKIYIAFFFSGICFIKFVFSIVMTVLYSNKVEKHIKPSVIFKLLTLFFVDILAGIFMLSDNSNEEEN